MLAIYAFMSKQKIRATENHGSDHMPYQVAEEGGAIPVMSTVVAGAARGDFGRIFANICMRGLLCMMLVSGAAQAAGPACHRPYSLALHEHGLLYSSSTDSGIDKDFANELIRRSGCQITVSLMSRARIWQLIESGALDFSLSGIATPERLRFASFAWYFSNKYYLLVRKDAGLHQLSELDGNHSFRLGVIRSFRYSASANRLVDRLTEQDRVTQAGGLDPLYRALLGNHIQGMIMEPFDYPVIEEKHIRDLTSILEFNDPSIPHGVIISNKSIAADERGKWLALVENMRTDGTVRRIARAI
jgi:polar amino acid transport system substrate-binding protein